MPACKKPKGLVPEGPVKEKTEGEVDPEVHKFVKTKYAHGRETIRWDG
jgi:hypothetical protein